MKETRSIKILSIIALSIAVLCLTVAYASMSETLKITGNASFDTAASEVSFQNMQVETTGSASYTLPTIINTSLRNYRVVIRETGDSVTLTFDILNEGVDATLSTLFKEIPICTGTGDESTQDEDIVCQNIEYSLTDEDSNIIQKDDLLREGSVRRARLTLTYKESQSPKNPVEISGLDIIMLYIKNH